MNVVLLYFHSTDSSYSKQKERYVDHNANHCRLGAICGHRDLLREDLQYA